MFRIFIANFQRVDKPTDGPCKGILDKPFHGDTVSVDQQSGMIRSLTGILEKAFFNKRGNFRCFVQAKDMVTAYRLITGDGDNPGDRVTQP